MGCSQQLGEQQPEKVPEFFNTIKISTLGQKRILEGIGAFGRVAIQYSSTHKKVTRDQGVANSWSLSFQQECLLQS
jgi:hypothetical protein